MSFVPGVSGRVQEIDIAAVGLDVLRRSRNRQPVGADRRRAQVLGDQLQPDHRHVRVLPKRRQHLVDDLSYIGAFAVVGCSKVCKVN
jgi:hypothetical protein